MKNKEKYAKEIIDIACSGHAVSVSKVTGKPITCENNSCKNCVRHNVDLICCEEERLKELAESEYIEKLVISKRDRAYLEYIREGYKFVARDKNGKLFVYGAKPYKDKTCKCWWGNDWCRDSDTPTLSLNYDVDFPMVKWEDSEPWIIEDLKKLEVVDEYEK